MQHGANNIHTANKEKGAERALSASDFLRAILPMLQIEHSAIRDLAVQALGRINKNAYRVLLEDAQPLVKTIIDDTKTRLRADAAKRTKRTDRLRLQLTHILQLNADYLRYEYYLADDALLGLNMTFIREIRTFLIDPDVQSDWEFQRLRQYFCLLVERVYYHVSRRPDSPRFLPYADRCQLFRMFEDWCGYGQYSNLTREREAKMMLTVLDQVKDIRERAHSRRIWKRNERH